MVFDYTLRPGPCPPTNALEIILKQCMDDAKGRKGVAVLTSKMGHWLPKASLFLKNGFTKADATVSNFELYVHKLLKTLLDL